MHDEIDVNSNNTAAALAFARKVTEPRILKVTLRGDTEEVIVSSDAEGGTHFATVYDLFADRAPTPIRRKGKVEVNDLASFIALTNRDSDPKRSVIFGDAQARKVTTVIDFHTEGGGVPQWGQDRIEYNFTLSPALTAWIKATTEKDGSPRVMDQKTFSRLIDDRLGDIDGSPMLTAESIAAQFAVRRGIRFASIPDLVIFTRTLAARSVCDAKEIVDENTGESSLQYTKKNDLSTNTGEPVTPPLAFVLNIPVLCGAEAKTYNIAARLRFDIDGGAKWKVELHALDKYITKAIDEALNVVRRPKGGTVDPPPETPSKTILASGTIGGCGLPVFMGVAPPM